VRNIVIFLIAGCVILVLLFYYFNIISYFLVVLVTLVSMISLFFVGAPLVDYVFVRFKWEDKALNVPKIAPIPYSLITLVTLCILMIALWIVTRSWFIVDCLAWCIGVTQIAVIRMPSLRICVYLLSAFLVYDVFWVFISPLIFGESVMVAVATQADMKMLPMTLTMPHVLDDPNLISILGLGDIVLPGLFICYTYAFDTALSSSTAPRSINDEIIDPPKVGYFVVSLVGYTAGFLATLISFAIMNKGQPALLYLVPFCLIPVSFASYMQNHLKIMWEGLPRAPPPDVEDQALLTVGDETPHHEDVIPTPHDSFFTVTKSEYPAFQVNTEDVVVPRIEGPSSPPVISPPPLPRHQTNGSSNADEITTE